MLWKLEEEKHQNKDTLDKTVITLWYKSTPQVQQDKAVRVILHIKEFNLRPQIHRNKCGRMNIGEGSSHADIIVTQLNKL